MRDRRRFGARDVCPWRNGLLLPNRGLAAARSKRMRGPHEARDSIEIIWQFQLYKSLPVLFFRSSNLFGPDDKHAAACRQCRTLSIAGEKADMAISSRMTRKRHRGAAGTVDTVLSSFIA